MTHRRLLLALGLTVTVPVAWAQDPAGPEFQINSFTTDNQWLPSVASAGNGNFVVVWGGRSQDGSGHGVFGQRFNAAGVPQGSEFQVNSFTTGEQFMPAVASDANGNFVVVWDSPDQDGSGSGIFGQRFSAAGVPQGNEFQVNSFTTGDQLLPAVASDASANFVVVWTSRFQDGSFDGVFGQRFNASGLPQGGEFQANSFTTATQISPAVASDASGNFVVVWETNIQDGSDTAIFGRRFNASGLPQGGEFQANSYTTGHQGYPAVASDPNGNFVVVWTSYGQGGSARGVFGQRFNGSGVPQGSEFQVHSYATSAQEASLASAADGNFVVVWSSYNQDGDYAGVFGQRFSAVGVPQGTEFQVNAFTTGHQHAPAVASAANGNFVVAWTSINQDGSYLGVFGQRFGDLIFKNGFE